MKKLARWAAAFALSLGGLAFNGYLLRPVLPTSVRDNDFLGFYAGGILAGTGRLYDQSAVLKIENTYAETPRRLAFIRLPFYAGILSPLRLLDYRRAFWAWQLCSLAAVAAFVLLWSGPKWAAAAVCCWSLPLFDCFVMSQDTALLLPLVALVVRHLRSGRRAGTGVAVALLSVKYHLFFSLPVLILRKRLWRAALVAAGGLSVLLAWSFVQEGWRWPAGYIAALRLPTTTPVGAFLPNLHGLFAGWPGASAWEVVMAAAVLAALWLCGGGLLNRAVAAVLIGGLLLSYHAFLADCTLLIPAALLLLEDRKPLYRLGGCVLATPVAFLGDLLPGFVHPAAVGLAVLLAMAAAALSACGWRGKRG